MTNKLIFNFYLSLISPLIALIVAVKDNDYHYVRISITLFLTIFGSIIMLHEGTDGYDSGTKGRLS